MKLFYLLAVFCLLALAAPLTAQTNNCVSCHQEIEDEDGPSHLINKDVHFQKGLGCADCHGGDPNLEDMDEVYESSDWRGVPDLLDVPQFCARCHSDAVYMRNHNPSLPTDQYDKYKTSVHGQRLLNNKDEKVATCISCHTVHEIGSGKLPHSSTHPTNVPATCGKCHADAEYMADYNIPTDQLQGFTESVHGRALLERKDLGAPACNDCHSNHGAAPPGLSSLAAVCGSCHAFQFELFTKSPHQEAFAENDFPPCETCHSHHKILEPFDGMVGTDEPAVCIECHSADDGTQAFAVADSISGALAELVAAQDDAQVVLDEAIYKGMQTTDAEFMAKDVGQTLIQARTMLHAFNAGGVLAKTAEGLAKADTVKAASTALIDEYYYRRKGLGWATLFITLLAIGLYIKIRRLP